VFLVVADKRFLQIFAGIVQIAYAFVANVLPE
jgi:hypothetical protein